MSLRYNSDSFDDNKSEANNLLELLEENLLALKEAREVIEEFESKAIDIVVEQIEEFEESHEQLIDEVEVIKAELQDVDDVSMDKLHPKDLSLVVDININEVIKAQKEAEELLSNIRLETSGTLQSWMSSRERELNDSVGETLLNPIDEMKQRKAERIYRSNKRVYEKFMNNASDYMKFSTEIEDIESERLAIEDLDENMYSSIAAPLIIPNNRFRQVAGTVSKTSGFDYAVGTAEIIASYGSKVAGYTLFAGTFIEDIITEGAGVLGDPWTLALSAELIEQGAIGLEQGKYRISSRVEYNQYINDAIELKNGKMPPDEICEFIADSYEIYSKYGSVTEYVQDMANSDDLEAMQDLALVIDGELVDKFGVIPEFGDSCISLINDYSLNGYFEAWDGANE